MVAILVAAVLAYAQADGCCFPDQWEGMLGGAIFRYHAFQPSPKVTTVLAKLVYDWTQKKRAMILENSEGAVLAKSIEDLNEKRQYIVKDDECHYYKLRSYYERACTDGYKPYPFRFGTKDEGLNMVSYVKKTDNYVDAISVIQPHCLPGSENYIGQSGIFSSVNANTDFYDITPGIKDPSVLVPPKGCKPGWKVGDEHRLISYNSTRIGILGLEILLDL